jgi:hypothetical protein
MAGALPTARTGRGHHLGMSPSVLPSASTQPPRTYLISGVLGVAFFTLAGLWWDGQSFVGSLFLELGGGAFIVFLLEVLLPSALGYAGTAFATLQTVTLLEWSPEAVEALLSEPLDEGERGALLAAVARGPYPARPFRPRGVSDTGETRHGQRVLAKALPAGRELRYYVSQSDRRRRTVVIVGLRRRRRGGG